MLEFPSNSLDPTAFSKIRSTPPEQYDIASHFKTTNYEPVTKQKRTRETETLHCANLAYSYILSKTKREYLGLCNQNKMIWGSWRPFVYDQNNAEPRPKLMNNFLANGRHVLRRLHVSDKKSAQDVNIWTITSNNAVTAREMQCIWLLWYHIYIPVSHLVARGMQQAILTVHLYQRLLFHLCNRNQ